MVRVGRDRFGLMETRNGLTEAAMIDGDALSKVRYLLDPARFQSLDPVFSRAAERMLAHLPAADRASTEHTTGLRYAGLEQFQAQQQKLKELLNLDHQR